MMAAEHRNEVILVGRLARDPSAKELPSGDVVTSWRLVVDRPSRAAGAETGDRPQRRNPPDALECVTFQRELAGSVATYGMGDILEVRGSVRRRFWRTSSGGVASRYEVETTEVRRLRAAEREPAP